MLPSQLTLLQAAALFCSLALSGLVGQPERSGFSRWARLVGCKGLCSGTKLFVDGSGAILCYTDTLPSAADSANSVLALVLCLKCCLSYSQRIQRPQETSIFWANFCNFCMTDQLFCKLSYFGQQSDLGRSSAWFEKTHDTLGDPFPLRLPTKALREREAPLGAELRLHLHFPRVSKQLSGVVASVQSIKIIGRLLRGKS